MNNMKTLKPALIAIMMFAALILASGMLEAQIPAGDRAAQMLSALSARIKAMGSYRVDFTVDVEGREITGWYVVSGNRYRLVTPQAEVVCDGKVKYEISRENREVIIDRVNTADRNILSNPTRAFDLAGGGFTSSYVGERSVDEVLCDVLRLEPRVGGDGLSGNDALGGSDALNGIELAVARKDGLPRAIVYSADGLSDDIHVSVNSFSAGATVENSTFIFDKKNYPGYEIVDFR